jgi:hypothetical protein
MTSKDEGTIPARVVTAVDATVDPSREAELIAGFQSMIDEPTPDGLLRSELLRGQDGAWRIQTTWRDFDSLMALRRRGARHAAVELLDRVEAEHTHAWFTVEKAFEPD